MRHAPLIRALAALLLPCSGCPPSTQGTGDDSGADFAQAPLPDCDPAGNLVANPSFEEGQGSARNTGAPASDIAGPWDGCCGVARTTTWQVERGAARCGAQAVRITSEGATDNVLNQTRTLPDQGGSPFLLSAWLQVVSAGPSGALRIDLFDLSNSQVAAESGPAGPGDVGAGWVRLQVTGKLPAPPTPMLQVRLRSTGTITALADDVALILR